MTCWVAAQLKMITIVRQSGPAVTSWLFFSCTWTNSPTLGIEKLEFTETDWRMVLVWQRIWIFCDYESFANKNWRLAGSSWLAEFLICVSLFQNKENRASFKFKFKFIERNSILIFFWYIFINKNLFDFLWSLITYMECDTRFLFT